MVIFHILWHFVTKGLLGHSHTPICITVHHAGEDLAFSCDLMMLLDLVFETVNPSGNTPEFSLWLDGVRAAGPDRKPLTHCQALFCKARVHERSCLLSCCKHKLKNGGVCVCAACEWVMAISPPQPLPGFHSSNRRQIVFFTLLGTKFVLSSLLSCLPH